jgi:hypothetical protein
VGNEKRGRGDGRRDTTSVAIFNSVGEIPKYKQSWESMRTSILPDAGKSDRSRGERDGEETGEGGDGKRIRK